jgi:hypothetical protein
MIEGRDIRVAMVAMRDGARLAVETLSELGRD